MKSLRKTSLYFEVQMPHKNMHLFTPPLFDFERGNDHIQGTARPSNIKLESYRSKMALKLPGDSREVLVSDWRGWQFDSNCEIFTLVDRKIKKKKK